AALATLSYTPAWVTTAKQAEGFTQQGFSTLDYAFYLYDQANGGSSPAVVTTSADGGLARYFSPYYSFLPPAPAGYAWTYGFTSQSTLAADGYTGYDTGGLYWFCLYPMSGASASQGVYRGIMDAQPYFSNSQFFVNTGGASTCGQPVNSAAPASFPVPVTVTVFQHYVAGNPP
ncbi:MAG: hypothetical protein RB191_08170, partial [Terriglobia bacterium]|nr:hypothetical protein [Terriglobia bacterium]